MEVNTLLTTAATVTAITAAAYRLSSSGSKMQFKIGRNGGHA
jgi:hypothetical protein